MHCCPHFWSAMRFGTHNATKGYGKVMTHLAPRQGLFAVVILASFCLHLLIFVITGTNQETTRATTHATHLAKSLAQELTLPLAINDPVGASVIASRHSTDPAIAFIGVYDGANKLIAPIGNQDIGTLVVEQPINNGMSIGKVIVKPKPISKSEVFLSYWVYLFCVLILHALIWFLYNHLARPDESYEQHIYHEVRKKLIASGIPLEDDTASQPVIPPSQVLPSADSINPVHAYPSQESDKKRSFGGLFDKLKTKDGSKEVNELETMVQAKNPPTEETFSYYTPSPAKAGDTLYIQLAFVDDNHLFNILEDSAKNTYLALCNQLLDKTTNKVLSRPLLAGVRLESIQHFEEQDGQWLACIKIVRSNNYARLFLAGAMIAKLLPTIHQFVYEKHRDMGMFALPIKAIVSDETRKEGALTLLQKRSEPSLLLLSNEDSNQVVSHFGLARHKEATNLYEKECRIITNPNDDMLKQMTELRNTILVQD